MYGRHTWFPGDILRTQLQIVTEFGMLMQIVKEFVMLMHLIKLQNLLNLSAGFKKSIFSIFQNHSNNPYGKCIGSLWG